MPLHIEYLSHYNAITDALEGVSGGLTIADFVRQRVINRGRVTIQKRVAELVEAGVLSKTFSHADNGAAFYTFETAAPLNRLADKNQERVAAEAHAEEIEHEQRLFDAQQKLPKTAPAIFRTLKGGHQERTSTIGYSADVSRNTILKHLRQLQALGLVEKDYSYSNADPDGGGYFWNLTKDGRAMAMAQAEPLEPVAEPPPAPADNQPKTATDAFRIMIDQILENAGWLRNAVDKCEKSAARIAELEAENAELRQKLETVKGVLE